MTDGMDDWLTEGQRRLSWIWLTCGYNNGMEGDEGLQDAICLKWCKAHAHAHHWAEEVELLVQEQCHTLQFLHWQSNWWLERQALIKTDDPALEEGLKAYAVPAGGC
ncbi:hypothetical protein J3R82DRAFT_9098 [Butyriboletus roseoflavus]|nr:hypothetical protein J3R82DRAFT_9098 [Butyriboletus roseoflavus]